MKGGSWHCTGGRDQDHPQEKNVKRQNGCLRRAYKELKEEEKLKPRRKDSESENCSVVFDSLRPHRLYSPWHSPGQNTRVSSCSILHGIVPTQGSNPGLPHSSLILLPAEPQGKPENTGVGSLSLLRHIFSTQESNWSLLHCRQILYQLSHQGSPVKSV